ncbi:PIG-L family deacetylase [Trujillonella endophytica]|uniref:N-acetylglucosaminyl deacetylase, LmbE family n=1 Tax=Trujillonella endophytica TaxID=673521 RepID=A0A1H8Q0T4_9ACTN|nr:PIG-L family deacetylase [Trujillella endophytica]SEO47686.1 N-acetylglucosaminyl deacetylase, LmbE family [Trujillella endophytica]
MTTSLTDVRALGTLLGVWAHPDDEAYLSAGLMAAARDAGSRVVCVTATRGEQGTADPVAWPPDALAAERTRELDRSLEVLGVVEHAWLGYADGGCDAVPAEEAVATLCAALEAVRPDTVLTFGPDGLTGHPDHRAVGRWTAAAVERAAPAGTRLLQAAFPARRVRRWSALDAELGVYLPGFPVVVPEDRLAVDLALDERYTARKVAALRAQATQTAGLIDAMGPDVYADWVAEETFVERPRRRLQAPAPAGAGAALTAG